MTCILCCRWLRRRDENLTFSHKLAVLHDGRPVGNYEFSVSHRLFLIIENLLNTWQAFEVSNWKWKWPRLASPHHTTIPITFLTSKNKSLCCKLRVVQHLPSHVVILTACLFKAVRTSIYAVMSRLRHGSICLRAVFVRHRFLNRKAGWRIEVILPDEIPV